MSQVNEIDGDIKFVSVSWSYFVGGWMLFIVGLLDYFLLGHLIGHPGENGIGEYIGQGVAVFLGGISFFYTVGLIPLIIGLIFIIYSICSVKIVVLANINDKIMIQEKRLLFPTKTELDYGSLCKIEYHNMGFRIKNSWILLFIPMAFRILQFGIPLFGEHRAADEILPTMMVITALVDLLVVFLVLIFPNQRLNFHLKEKIYSMTLSPISNNRSTTSKIQQLIGLDNKSKEDGSPLLFPKGGYDPKFNSGNHSIKDSKNFFRLEFGLGLIFLSLVGLSLEIIWGTDLCMVGITYGIWLVINALKRDFSDATSMERMKNSTSSSEIPDVLYSTQNRKFFSKIKILNIQKQPRITDSSQMRKIDVIDIIGLGLLLYFSTLELTWSWMFLNIFNGLILLDLIISTLAWLILVIFIAIYIGIPVELLNVNTDAAKFSFRIYEKHKVFFPSIGIHNLKDFKDFKKIVKNFSCKKQILFRTVVFKVLALAIILYGIFSVVL
ncbi:MAG: hypothetical protein ACTSRK_00095 [Promethearchaeota archaeon]